MNMNIEQVLEKGYCYLHTSTGALLRLYGRIERYAEGEIIFTPAGSGGSPGYAIFAQKDIDHIDKPSMGYPIVWLN